MKNINLSLLFASLVILGINISACEGKKGSAEKAGERIDEMIDNVKDGDPVLHKKGTLEKAGEAADDAINEGKENVDKALDQDKDK